MNSQFDSSSNQLWPQFIFDPISLSKEQNQENSLKIINSQFQIDKPSNSNHQLNHLIQPQYLNQHNYTAEKPIKTMESTLIPFVRLNLDQKLQTFSNEQNSDNPNNLYITKDAKIKKKESSKKYRNRKRQYVTSLQQENKALKNKINQLSYRLNEAQFTIKKLKYGDQPNTKKFQEMKNFCLKEISQLLSGSKIDSNEIANLEKKLEELICFTGKQKIDILNYYMSELLENAVDDREVYFLDCILHKRGVYRQNSQIPLRKIDQQVLEIFNVRQDMSGETFFRQEIPQYLAQSALRLKYFWQQLYLNYLKLLNEGFNLETLVDSFKEKIKTKMHVSIPLQISLFFQKSKFRPDMRQLRKQWFSQLHSEDDIRRQLDRVKCLAEKNIQQKNKF